MFHSGKVVIQYNCPVQYRIMNFGEEFSLQIVLANKTYHQYLYQFFDQAEAHYHYQIILLLSRYKSKLTQKMLCDELGIEKSNMAAIIDNLEEKGYVTREVNYKDRRSKIVQLTPKADEILNELSSAFDHFESNVTHEISWQEMYSCISVLKRINENLVNFNQKALN